jgi:hypothetical protein
MFRKIWKARKEITTLIDNLLRAAEDRQITKAEIDQLTADVIAVVNRIKAAA